MSDAYQEVMKECGNCLHQGIDGNTEPCLSCLEGAKNGRVFSKWKPWKKSTEDEFRRRLTEGE